MKISTPVQKDRMSACCEARAEVRCDTSPSGEIGYFCVQCGLQCEIVEIPSPEKEVIDLNEPKPIDMHSSPIGSIPFVAVGASGAIQKPSYFMQLCQEAFIAFRGGSWCILREDREIRETVRGRTVKRISSNTEKHEKFLMMLDCVRALSAKWLSANEYDSISSKIDHIDRDDLLRAALGLTTDVKVRSGDQVIVTSVNKITELRGKSTQAVFDWLHENSGMQKYAEQKKSFQDNLTIHTPDFAKREERMSQRDLPF